jgi:hypothetical protein
LLDERLVDLDDADGEPLVLDGPDRANAGGETDRSHQLRCDAARRDESGCSRWLCAGRGHETTRLPRAACRRADAGRPAG